MKKDVNFGTPIVVFMLILFLFVFVGLFLKENSRTKVTHVTREKHLVTNVKRHISRSVQDEMNLYYDVTIDDTNTFKTLHQYQVGDTIYYEIYKIQK